MGDLTVDELNAAAARLYPAEWARMEALSGKKRSRARHTLRKSARFRIITDPLREAGHACQDCCKWQRSPPGISGRHCEAQSDFYGYVITAADDICEHWAGVDA